MLVDARNSLGEGVLWQPGGGAQKERMHWVDINAEEKHTITLGQEGVILQHEIKSEEKGTAGGISKQGNSRGEDFISTEVLGDFVSDTTLVRTNDGRLHPNGKTFWIGTMYREPDQGVGDIYSISRSKIQGKTGWQNIKKQFSNIRIPNAICFSRHGDTLYFTDSPTRKIYRCLLNPKTGIPLGPIDQKLHDGPHSPGRLSMVFIDLDHYPAISPHAEPDGAITDRDGNLYIAMYIDSKRADASYVAKFNNQGDLVALFPVPTPQVTCPAFDSAGRLYATSAHQGMTDARRRHHPHAGGLWRTFYSVISPECPAPR
ncbi:MAG: SMP-30/gluconolactonase/LRE family protein [Alphaproteobacteria bacterium]|nr:SMP-30/gluconolactonase/LRE family protein [Alphaproteobacteria bacterium]